MQMKHQLNSKDYFNLKIDQSFTLIMLIVKGMEIQQKSELNYHRQLTF